MRELFVRFSRKEEAVHSVMRALMAYEDFYIPQQIAPEGQVHSVALVLSESWPSTLGEQLFVFTDPQAAIRARDYLPHLGVYAGGQDALSFIGKIPERGWPGGITINPGPRDQRWVMPAQGYPLVTAWATGVAIEKLAAAGDSPRLRELVARHTFLVPVVDDAELLHTASDGSRAIVLCAAIDVSQRILSRFSGRRVEAYPSTAAQLARHSRKNGLRSVFLGGVNVALPLEVLEG